MVDEPLRVQWLGRDLKQPFDRLKEVVPVWKKEIWEGGEVWIEGEPVGGDPS